MRKFALKDMEKGWIVGDFVPSVLKTEKFEVGLKNYKKGHTEKKHFHKVACEITVLVEGKARMCDTDLSAGDIVLLEPGEVTGFEALTDCLTLVIKSPSVQGDKYLSE